MKPLKRFHVPDVYYALFFLPVIAGIATLSSFIFPLFSSKGPVLIQTVSADAAGLARALPSQFISMTKDGEGVRIVSRNNLLVRGTREPLVHDVTLQVGDGFTIPDKHATQEFSLKAVRKDGIELAYHERFDARDFGSNKITDDSGIVIIPWQEGAK